MEKFVEEIISKIMNSKSLGSEISENFILFANQGIAKISDVTKREKCYKDLSIALAKSGLFHRAIEIAKTIEGAEYRCYVFSLLVSQMAENENYTQALELIHQIQDVSYREDAIGYLVRSLSSKGKKEESKKIVQKLVDPTDKELAIKLLKATQPLRLGGRQDPVG
jgi:hypothetical protein